MSILFLVFLLTVLAVPNSGNAAELHFTWDAPSAGDVQGYIMERKTGLTGTYVEVTSPMSRPTGTTWTDSKVAVSKNTPVCYRVFAFGAGRKSGSSNELCLNVPDAPGNIRVVIETSGPSETQPRVSVRTRVRKQ